MKLKKFVQLIILIIFLASGCECIFEAWLLSFASLQLNMAKSCFKMNFSFIRRALLLIQDTLKDGQFSK